VFSRSHELVLVDQGNIMLIGKHNNFASNDIFKFACHRQNYSLRQIISTYLIHNFKLASIHSGGRLIYATVMTNESVLMSSLSPQGSLLHALLCYMKLIAFFIIIIYHEDCCML